VDKEPAGNNPPLNKLESQAEMNRQVGILIVIAGAGLVIVGLLIYSGALWWFGRLPGDIRYESEHTRIYFPIVSSLLASVVLSLLFYLVRRFF
jgi:Protein of unknown function (DUF2905)